MHSSDRRTPTVHRDVALFREAVTFTAAQTGFSQRLIEKDYFCTVLLAHLASADDTPLVFKGGPCLAKIHADFYDVDYGVTWLGLRPTEPEFVTLVREKIAVPGNDPVDVSDLRLSSLQRQLTTRLRPVLRQHHFDQFDLDRAVGTLLQIAETLEFS